MLALGHWGDQTLQSPTHTPPGAFTFLHVAPGPVHFQSQLLASAISSPLPVESATTTWKLEVPGNLHLLEEQPLTNDRQMQGV